MISAFIIKELRGAWALRLFCGRSAFPPPYISKELGLVIVQDNRAFSFAVTLPVNRV
jgi:hypothetical protein